MTTRVFGRLPKAAIVATGLALVLGVAGFAAGEKAEKAAGANPPATLKLADQHEGPSRNSFAPVVKQVTPAVVSIESTKVIKASARGNSQLDLRQFFGDNGGDDNSPFGFAIPNAPQGDMKQQGVGSGVIVSPQGYILTNNHVVDGANTVVVTLSDKREYKARVIGTDKSTDIAVIKIDAGSNLPVLTIGDSEKVEIGDFAIAVGNPFNVGQTVTMGIVSATHRGAGGQIEGYEDFIQTDAAINPGNSGGALVNDRGELIGINTAIIAHGSEGNQGIGFAVPVNLARNVMDQLIKNGKVTRAYLGVYPQDVTPQIAKQFNRAPGGALIADVSAGTPAERAGLQRGDIVTEVNGHSVADANQLRNAISVMDPDAHVNLKVVRGGAEKSIAVTLGEQPTETAENTPRGGGRRGNSSNSDDAAVAGISVAPGSDGLTVTNVRANSPAAEAGLRQGDVIQEVNRKAVTSVNEFRSAVRANAGDEGALLLVKRGGRTFYVAVS